MLDLGENFARACPSQDRARVRSLSSREPLTRPRYLILKALSREARRETPERNLSGSTIVQDPGPFIFLRHVELAVGDSRNSFT
jgi:hypothetical protein